MVHSVVSVLVDVLLLLEGFLPLIQFSDFNSRVKTVKYFYVGLCTLGTCAANNGAE